MLCYELRCVLHCVPQLCQTVTARKVATALSFLLAATFLVLMGFYPASSNEDTLITFYVVVAVAALGISTPGWNVNHQDIAPR